jgi:hypothetical protein
MKLGWFLHSILPFFYGKPERMLNNVQVNFKTRLSNNRIGVEEPSTIDGSGEVRNTSPFWEEMKKNCIGCWSGGIIHTKYRDGELIPKSDKLNMRLMVNIQQQQQQRDDSSCTDQKHYQQSNNIEKGLWTVWNVKKVGDQIVVPLQSFSEAYVTTHKIWFDRILLRTSKEGPVGVELGFWDREGDGMRRTVVVEYHGVDKNLSTENEKEDSTRLLQQYLGDIAILQQKVMKEEGFVGHDVNDEHANILPDDSESVINNEWETLFETWKQQPSKRLITETVNIQNLERTQKKTFIPERVVEDLANKNNSARRFTKKLQNGIFVSLPTSIDNASINSLYFCNKYKDGRTVISEVQFVNYNEPLHAILYKLN